MTDQLYNADTLAKYLGVSARTIRRWRNSGAMPEPVALGHNNEGLWSPQQARLILERRIRNTNKRKVH